MQLMVISRRDLLHSLLYTFSSGGQSSLCKWVDRDEKIFDTCDINVESEQLNFSLSIALKFYYFHCRSQMEHYCHSKELLPKIMQLIHQQTLQGCSEQICRCPDYLGRSYHCHSSSQQHFCNTGFCSEPCGTIDMSYLILVKCMSLLLSTCKRISLSVRSAKRWLFLLKKTIQTVPWWSDNLNLSETPPFPEKSPFCPQEQALHTW